MGRRSYIGWRFMGKQIKSNFEINDKKKRICFVCSTPLQVMHCLNIARNNFDSDKYIKDIYLEHSFYKSNEVAEKLATCGCFENVFVFGTFNAKVQSSVILRILSLLCPVSILKYYNLNEEYEICRYDNLFISMYNYFTRTIILSLQFDKICLYEDGIGLYLGTTLDNTKNPFVVRLLNRFLFHNKLNFKPDKVYLSDSSFFCNSFGAELVKLKNINNDNKSLDDIKKVFSYKQNNIYKQNHLVYLTQPLDEINNENASLIENMFLNQISKECLNDYVIRLHPRQKQESYQYYRRDTYNNLWELECIYQITGNNVLVSYYSTAAFMPVILFNKKPYIIFLKNILEEKLSEQIKENMEKMIGVLENLYGSEKNRVIVPSSIEDAIYRIKLCLDEINEDRIKENE